MQLAIWLEHSSSGDYGRSRLTPSVTSYWGVQIAIPTIRNQWNLSLIGGRDRIMTSMAGIVMINRNFLSIFSICLRHSQDRSPSRTHEFESTHSKNKWRKSFCTCVDRLTVGSQLRYQDRIPIWSKELISQVPCGTGSCTRGRVWD